MQADWRATGPTPNWYRAVAVHGIVIVTAAGADSGGAVVLVESGGYGWRGFLRKLRGPGMVLGDAAVVHSAGLARRTINWRPWAACRESVVPLHQADRQPDQDHRQRQMTRSLKPEPGKGTLGRNRCRRLRSAARGNRQRWNAQLVVSCSVKPPLKW
jgi:hypothetical protein